MAKVLTVLKREKEITPRLEEAARHDSKNVPLQYRPGGPLPRDGPTR